MTLWIIALFISAFICSIVIPVENDRINYEKKQEEEKKIENDRIAEQHMKEESAKAEKYADFQKKYLQTKNGKNLNFNLIKFRCSCGHNNDIRNFKCESCGKKLEISPFGFYKLISYVNAASYLENIINNNLAFNKYGFTFSDLEQNLSEDQYKEFIIQLINMNDIEKYDDIKELSIDEKIKLLFLINCLLDPFDKAYFFPNWYDKLLPNSEKINNLGLNCSVDDLEQTIVESNLSQFKTYNFDVKLDDNKILRFGTNPLLLDQYKEQIDDELKEDFFRKKKEKDNNYKFDNYVSEQLDKIINVHNEKKISHSDNAFSREIEKIFKAIYCFIINSEGFDLINVNSMSTGALHYDYFYNKYISLEEHEILIKKELKEKWSEDEEYLEWVTNDEINKFHEIIENEKRKVSNDYEKRQREEAVEQRKQILDQLDSTLFKGIECPYCHMKAGKKISVANRAAGAAVFGAASSNTGKTYKCGCCGAKW